MLLGKGLQNMFRKLLGIFVVAASSGLNADMVCDVDKNFQVKCKAAEVYKGYNYDYVITEDSDIKIIYKQPKFNWETDKNYKQDLRGRQYD